MSRIGKKIINIPAKTEIAISGSKISVKGPKGTIEREVSPLIDIKVSSVDGNNVVTISPKEGVQAENIDALWGTFASHVINLIKGVNETFTKKLLIEGIGYKADVKGTNLVLALGFSHPVNIPIPSSLKVASDKGIITISGLDKDEVGQFSATIRALKKPEPYKGKGIRYENEVIRRKQGKKTV